MGRVSIIGGAGLSARLQGVSFKLVNGPLRAGMRQGANVFSAQAKANFNTGDGPSDIAGILRKSIRVTARRGTPDRVVFNVVAGELTASQIRRFGADSAYYALWVERGHINRKLHDALRGTKRFVGYQRSVSESNTPAHPYMLPALEAKAQEVIELVARITGDGLPELGE